MDTSAPWIKYCQIGVALGYFHPKFFLYLFLLSNDKIHYVLLLAFTQLGSVPSIFPYVYLHHQNCGTTRMYPVILYCQCLNEPAHVKNM